MHLRPRLARGVPRQAARASEPGEEHDQRAILRKLVDMQYERNDMNLVRGKFRVRGDTIEVHPAYDETAVRIELFGDEIERIQVVDPLTGEQVKLLDELVVFPNTHYVVGDERMRVAIGRIEAELQERLAYFEQEGKLLEAQRLRMRTQYDLEMMQEVGFCSGIENYSAPIDGRGPGEPPHTLLDFFPKDFLVVLDESHVTVPQLHGQYEGDRSRKETLIDARLPAAVGRRQPAAAVRGVHGAGRPGRVPVGHARARTSARCRARSSSRSCGRPAWSTPR